MGGPGSGTWYRWDNRTRAEDVRCVDIRYMHKHGLLRSLGSGTLSWSRNDVQTASIRFRIEEDRLVLNYRYRTHGNEWEDIEQPVLFDRTACNYGGERVWFLCPHCSRRVAVLYGAGAWFLCRHCYRLPYSSQQETYADRMRRKARKIRDSLGASNNLMEPVWEKPRGMHWRTFNKDRSGFWYSHRRFAGFNTLGFAISIPFLLTRANAGLEALGISLLRPRQQSEARDDDNSNESTFSAAVLRLFHFVPSYLFAESPSWVLADKDSPTSPGPGEVDRQQDRTTFPCPRIGSPSEREFAPDPRREHQHGDESCPLFRPRPREGSCCRSGPAPRRARRVPSISDKQRRL